MQSKVNMRNYYRCLLLIVFLLLGVFGLFLGWLGFKLGGVIILLLLCLFVWCLFYFFPVKLGLKMLWVLFISKVKIERQMTDARIFVERRFNGGWGYWVPLMRFVYDGRDLYLRVRNCVKFEEKLSVLDLSPALYGSLVVVSTQFLTDDRNWWVFKIGTSNFRQLRFDSQEEASCYALRYLDYNVLDNEHIYPFSHILISGMTGSGKTSLIRWLCLQDWSKRIDLKIIDAKRGPLSVWGRKKLRVPVATEPEECVEMLEDFEKEMNKCSVKYQQMSDGRGNCCYSDFGLPTHYLFIDELSALVGRLEGNKDLLNRFKRAFSNVLFLGRELGFFLVVGMQQANAKVIATSEREQFGQIVVMGNSGEQTYNVAFGQKTVIPQITLKVGQGFVKANSKANIDLIWVPFLNFE